MALFIVTSSSSSIFRILVIIFCFGLHASNSQVEYFSSIDSIKLLTAAEKYFIEEYKKFIETQAEDFTVYRNFIAKVKEDHEVALEDPEEYFSNPINAFKLIKRTVNEWAQLTEYVKNHTRLQALKTNLTALESEMKFPDSSELRGAAKGLGRIQTMYNLTTNHLATGIINGIDYGTELSIADCFEIGANLFESQEYPLAIKWFELVLKYLEMGENANITESVIKKEQDEFTEILYLDDDDDDEGIEDNLNNEHYKQRDDKKKKKIGQEKTEEHEYEDHDELFNEQSRIYDKKSEKNKIIIKENLVSNKNDVSDAMNKNAKSEETDEVPTIHFTKATSAFKRDIIEEKMFIETIEYLALAKYELNQREEAISYIKQLLEINPEHAFKDLDIYMDMKEPINQEYAESLNVLQQKEWYANYSRLCQGKQLPQKDFHKLSCTLDTLNHPLFILAPLKKEQLLDDPEIVVYYGLLSDAQILDIREEADLYMHRSKVGIGSSSKVRDTRVSQQAWLHYRSRTLKYINRTVGAISGYDMFNADLMQVANYGIGGQYDPHHDYMGVNLNGTLHGDRLATHLFYASDVNQGGYTVFPLLNVYSKPVKGAMLMWHNLHKSLDPDLRTFHAGCPVIVGTKRIFNVWVHSSHQEFRRPCDVIRDNYKSEHLSF